MSNTNQANTPDIANPVRTRAIMNTYGIAVKKSLGQNFLSDTNILANIVQAADITDEDDVIEVGPGIGALTEQLARHAHRVLAFEIDRNLIPVLADTLLPYDNIEVVNADILKVNIEDEIASRLPGAKAVKVVANLPYYITTPILMGLVSAPVDFAAIVVMMQKEVAERLSAQPGTKAYGALTLAVQYKMQAKIAFTVARTAFIPQPNVDSAIVTLTPREPLAELPFTEAALFRLIRGCFEHRRKSLWNNLQSIFGKAPATKEALAASLADLGIDQGIRAERLSLEEFIALTNVLHGHEVF
ncbi:16S rRNA (adenine(1518)-N(6)/adenine(1519)-N(6))-dimethyltransferase RsmA [Furfurilactobacillus siliginis]|uniref:Ribosomal RNA small subunit methyltransferase A n=1 Tax=Furfurilactobacillus siliginis TaxID=348151 RepID=A0A0R2L850_9LACO|nr:16S rRNA (adenine(1518)-N(6)/adenine(1519)-N(6))-dimethyltransferase RsmA [Furfurilactobacillus siliginis]KRN95989.1 dimethyladenosine transferase [Furfurilactobacillus siliginis]GEK28844.1 ribosomal RNA small subunit methyltransferase A [Furfurilactobacillus siliginis]